MKPDQRSFFSLRMSADFRQQLDIGRRRRRGSRLFFFRLFERQFADDLDEHENRKSDDDEIDGDLNEIAVIERHFRRNDLAAFHDSRSDDEFQIVEMNPADQKSQYRHQDVGNQRRDDFAKSATDDDTDSHVDHIGRAGRMP